MKKSFIRLALISTLLSLPCSVSANYTVIRGDSLSKIADAKYGNWIKWKNLWAVNRDQVKNPNLIYPGQRLRLLEDKDLDLYASSEISREATPVREKVKIKSQEWRLLPTQPWEKFVFKFNSAVDADGFDRRSRVANRVADKTNAEITISTERAPIYGEIVSARTEFERVFLGETVFIRGDEPLQVGTLYSVTSGPQKIKSKRDGRVGFAYDLTGKVRIIGVRDGVFIGTITALYHPIQRHQLLIPVIDAYEFPMPVVSNAPIVGTVVVTKNYQEDLLGEQKVVLIDLGKEDGVKPGNIFRSYLHSDPGTHEVISAKDYLIESELQILSVMDQFSIAVILHGRNAIRFGDEVVALTDLTDFDKHQGMQAILQEKDNPESPDSLDAMDETDGLGEKETHELHQLEKWSKPAPEAPPISENILDNEEIKRIDVHENARRTVEVGNENAPNDKSGNPSAPEAVPEASPKSVPETAPALAPEATPEPTSVPVGETPLGTSDTPPIKEETLPPVTDPFSIPEQPPVAP